MTYVTRGCQNTGSQGIDLWGVQTGISVVFFCVLQGPIGFEYVRLCLVSTPMPFSIQGSLINPIQQQGFNIPIIGISYQDLDDHPQYDLFRPQYIFFFRDFCCRTFSNRSCAQLTSATDLMSWFHQGVCRKTRGIYVVYKYCHNEICCLLKMLPEPVEDPLIETLMCCCASCDGVHPKESLIISPQSQCAPGVLGYMLQYKNTYFYINIYTHK